MVDIRSIDEFINESKLQGMTTVMIILLAGAWIWYRAN